MIGRFITSTWRRFVPLATAILAAAILIASIAHVRDQGPQFNGIEADADANLATLEIENMDEKAVIDRIDEQRAVLLVGENERERIVPAARLPKEAQPGTWLRVRFDGEQLIEAAVDVEETERVRERIGDKMDRLRQRGRRFRPLE